MRGNIDLGQGSSRGNHEKWSDSEYVLKSDLIRFCSGFDEDCVKEKSRITPSFCLSKWVNDGAIFLNGECCGRRNIWGEMNILFLKMLILRCIIGSCELEQGSISVLFRG